MGIHTEGNGLVAVPQLFGYTGYFGAVGDCNAGKGVLEFMGMKARYIILLGKFLHIPGRGLGVHRLRAVLLGKDIGADGVACLLLPELLEQANDLWVSVNRPYLAALGGVKVNALLRCVAEIPPNRDCTNIEVDVFSLHPAALALADTSVD